MPELLADHTTFRIGGPAKTWIEATTEAQLVDAVRAADAPGTSAPSPLGLRAGEFITLVKYAASLANTRIIEFSEVNPSFDVDHRTTRLVAIGMHRICTAAG